MLVVPAPRYAAMAVRDGAAALAGRVLRAGHRAARGGARDAARHDRARLPARRPPAPERRARRVGAGAARARDPAARSPRGSSGGAWFAGDAPASSRSGSGSARTSSGTCRRCTTRRSATRTRSCRSSTRATSSRGSRCGGRSSTAAAPALRGAKAAYLFAAFVLASPLGLLLALIPSAVYDFYRDAPRRLGAVAAGRPADRRA